MILRLKKMDRHFTHFASVLVWFRRDLRLDDHTALSRAVQDSDKVYGCFVFDQAILKDLPAHDRRVSFIHASVTALDNQWREQAGDLDSGLRVRYGHAVTEVVQLAKQLGVQAVFTHHDVEPQSLVNIHTAVSVLGPEAKENNDDRPRSSQYSRLPQRH